MRVDIAPGPWLLSSERPDLLTHRARFGRPAPLSAAELADLADRHTVVGRGGAGFPFATKLRVAAAGRARHRHVVVNLSEGEPASAKDAALVAVSPHLVLDGAALTAMALGARSIEIVLPHDRDSVEHAIAVALAERERAGESARLHWRLRRAGPRFVSSESSAVIELIEGRANLPVTSWAPAAVKGVNGQPTLLSNGETFAQVAALALAGDRVPGPRTEPGTRLLSITRGDRIEVREIVHGTPWAEVLDDTEIGGPVLIGGFHGQWAGAGALRQARVSAGAMAGLGLTLGAGVVVPLPSGNCGLSYTAGIVRYLAGQSAGRCGPCVNGLPMLSSAFAGLVDGRSGHDLGEITALVRGRGACAHPDGVTRLVDSVRLTFADEIRAHASGSCSGLGTAQVIR